ncbi:hypothetical protein GT347_08955 [Xylophilus rhododendri]|uniref:Adenylate kinase n=1 Tax=Xylophilus rhododendri TaxID=2697032 RepID=A0A857JBZ1_9BURK|nr:hypothetical protein GT347_08955 [Xylophilus rhododendri]
MGRVLVTGAAGCGTTTLGRALAQAADAPFLDADDFFWLPTDPPYRSRRTAADRYSLLTAELAQRPQAVVAGSLMGWGAELEDAFDLVVFLYLPTALRLARLRAREEARFGKADPEFLDWASQYDAGTAQGRSLALHRQWLAERKCRVLLLEGDMTTAARVQAVLQALA